MAATIYNFRNVYKIRVIGRMPVNSSSDYWDDKTTQSKIIRNFTVTRCFVIGWKLKKKNIQAGEKDSQKAKQKPTVVGRNMMQSRK